jgi:hypothetical protein
VGVEWKFLEKERTGITTVGGFFRDGKGELVPEYLIILLLLSEIYPFAFNSTV